jgi:hypothetical protein
MNERFPHEFLGRCSTCLDNAYLDSESCLLGYGNGMPVTEDECLIRSSKKAWLKTFDEYKARRS